ncbi:LacI family DNA-binding transcriptional regulator [Ectobacillus ponti]|uniref:LacI family transcriptional regulator n=1 Tax=Ectobacillus ponti TaxID=2961894 RepID=A0AA41X683_9BACI|nr:LacI family DNA-binding transcriptional regulator [Ectobacillus ponti]MCP8969457.1 LacI family transcriptional regulator [Ectobacillus ponti]
MSTIDDVAKLAGLSKSTVSRVINSYPHVSEAKRQRVLAAMQQLAYVPNSAAQSLRRQRTGLIAVFVPRLMNPFFSQLLQSMELAASERDYQLIVCQTMYSQEKELKYAELLRRKQVDGIVMTSIQNEWQAIAPYVRYGPIVLCNEFDDAAEVPMIRLNQEYGGYIAGKHLLAMGHTRIACCSGGTRSQVAFHREQGLRKALQEHSLFLPDTYIFRDAYSIEDGIRVFAQIKDMKIRPTAVFSGGDEVAAGIIAGAKQHGCRVPEDLAVIGFDDQKITVLMEPNISTVRQPIGLMAQQTIALMAEKIESRQYTQREVYEYPLELIVRESTCVSVLPTKEK